MSDRKFMASAKGQNTNLGAVSTHGTRINKAIAGEVHLGGGHLSTRRMCFARHKGGAAPKCCASHLKGNQTHNADLLGTRYAFPVIQSHTTDHSEGRVHAETYVTCEQRGRRRRDSHTSTGPWSCAPDPHHILDI